MTRSRTAALVVMGLMPLWLSACNAAQKSQQVFTTLESCAQAGVPGQTCRMAYQQAVIEAPNFAPWFASRKQCAQQYDDDTCAATVHANGSATWQPTMYGFLIGRAVRDGETNFYSAGPVFHKCDDSDYSVQYGRVYASNAGGWHAMPSDEAVGVGDMIARDGFGGEHGDRGLDTENALR